MTKTSYKPFPGWIVLEPLEEKDFKPSTESNITLAVPESMSQKDSAGTVIAVGDAYILHEGGKEYHCPPPVKIGDMVVYKNVTGQKYLDFNTGLWRIFIKWHPEPYWSDLVTRLEYDN